MDRVRETKSSCAREAWKLHRRSVACIQAWRKCSQNIGSMLYKHLSSFNYVGRKAPWSLLHISRSLQHMFSSPFPVLLEGAKDMRSKEALHICLLLCEAYIYTPTNRYVTLTLINYENVTCERQHCSLTCFNQSIIFMIYGGEFLPSSPPPPSFCLLI